MAKTENKNEYKVGDKVWYFDPWGNLTYSIIYEKSQIYVLTQNRVMPHMPHGCYPTKEACIDAKKREDKAQKAEYKESIKSVKGLVQFMFKHNIHSESDLVPREAVRERAAELRINLSE